MIFIIFAILIILILFFLITIYNKLVKEKLYVNESFSTIDTYLKKRYDLIPNLVATVKGYKEYEAQTLEKIILARNGYINANSLEDKIKNENSFSEIFTKLFALQEAYPDLKANENFLTLQSQLTKIEEDILQARKYYNGCVRNYNTSCETFPNVIIARLFNFEKYSFFTIENTEEKQNVKINF